MKYRTIVADPPWRYAAPKTQAGAEPPYPTMSLADICALDVGASLESDAHLWLWGTNGLLEQAFQVMRAWGFFPLTMVTWCKRQPGTGSYVRNNTEHVLLASRGRPMTPEHKPISTWYIWPRAEHSRKPDAFYDLVEQVSPGPYLELFARRNRLGWDTWGNECLEHVAVES
jgi:N6-adenosine-specific RNA methylase IME4